MHSNLFALEVVMITPEILTAYENAYYFVQHQDGEFVLRVGQPSQKAKQLLSGFNQMGAILITACNPFGKLLPKTS